MPLPRPALHLLSVSLLALTACGFNGADTDEAEVAASPAPEPTVLADAMHSNDPAPGLRAEVLLPDSQPRPVMQLQVVLDRLGFSPGVVDGQLGAGTRNALTAFQEARSLPETGELDQATQGLLDTWQNIPATRVVTIPADWGSLAFQPVPDGAEAQADMAQLGYASLDEKLAERFHTTLEVLRELNPGGRPAGAAPVASAAVAAPFRAGQQIRVPNIGADEIAPGAIQDRAWQQTLASLGVGSTQARAAQIVVDESDTMLRVFDDAGKLAAAFTVSTGSSRDPLPIGEWGINGVAHNPPFAYQPDLFWDVPDNQAERQLPPGPNGPVGVVWIDLTKEHYGIHGTPEPQTIGRAQSHGCVRLTNWDAARLAGMVSGSTRVTFRR